MKLFFFKPKRFSPLLIIVAKISSKDELEKIEAMSSEIFHILMDNADATEDAHYTRIRGHQTTAQAGRAADH